MPKEIFIYVDFTEKSNTKITVSSYTSSLHFTQNHDINLLPLIDAINYTLKGYKNALSQSSKNA